MLEWNDVVFLPMLRDCKRKIATHHKHKKGRVFAVISLATSLGAGAFWTIFPLILEENLQSDFKVGIYYSLIAFFGLIGSILSTWLFQRYSKVLITKISLSTSLIALFGMTMAKNIWHISGLDVPRSICIMLTGIALSLFVRDFAKNEELPLEEGRYYLYGNIGWFIGPALGGYAAKFFGNESVFIIAGVFYCVALMIFLHQHLVVKNPALSHKKHEEGIGDLFANIRLYFRNSELIKVFLVALGMYLWFYTSGIYIPLQIISLGFSPEVVGLVISGSMLPLLILEARVGGEAKEGGTKKYIVDGYAILMASVLSFVLLAERPLLLLVAFCLINIGAALIEPLQEAYFFKVVKKPEKERFFGIYHASEPLASIIAPMIGGFLIAIGGYNGLWIGMACVMAVFTLISFSIKEQY